jgi:hypothetical protein
MAGAILPERSPARNVTQPGHGRPYYQLCKLRHAPFAYTLSLRSTVLR